MSPTTKNYYSRDGTLVYDVGFYVMSDVRYYWWHISLTDEQAETVRGALEKLATDGKVGHWKVDVMTVQVDDLAEAADLIRELERRPDAETITSNQHNQVRLGRFVRKTSEPVSRPGRAR